MRNGSRGMNRKATIIGELRLRVIKPVEVLENLRLEKRATVAK